MKKAQHKKCATRKECNMKKVQHEKSATREKCDMEIVQHEQKIATANVLGSQRLKWFQPVKKLVF